MKLCECGCGSPAPLAKVNDKRKGHVRGEPVRFVSGHNARGKPKSPETRARMAEYARNRSAEHHALLVEARRSRPLVSVHAGTIHDWLRRNHVLLGTCDRCGQDKETEFAFLRHPAPYTYNREDYAEMCRRCHMYFDIDTGIRPQWSEWVYRGGSRKVTA